MDTFINLLQLLGGIILTVGYIPQIKKMIKTKEVESFSISSLSMVFFGVLLMEVYANYLYFFKEQALAFLITNTLSLICAGVVLVLTIIYKKK